MSFYPVPSRPAILGVEVPGVDQGAVDRSGAVVVAVPVSALVWPVRAGSGIGWVSVSGTVAIVVHRSRRFRLSVPGATVQ